VPEHADEGSRIRPSSGFPSPLRSLKESDVSDRKNSAATQPTIIGETCRIKGDIALDGGATILGGIEGHVEVTGNLEIGPAGTVHGGVRAGAVIVRGRVDGDLVCTQSLELVGELEGDVTCGESVELGPEATLVGNLNARSVTINPGAAYRGQVVIGAEVAEQLGIATTTSAGTDLETDEDVDTEETAVAGVLRRRPGLLTRSGAVSA
jgi:cytoskeletal protein CcmA (bactofilin family)